MWRAPRYSRPLARRTRCSPASRSRDGSATTCCRRRRPAVPEAGFRYLFDGSEKSADLFAKWSEVGGGNFILVGRSLIAQPDPNGIIGLLYYAAEQFDNFTLRLDFCLPHPRGNSNDNSGVFVRFRNPQKPVLPGTPGPDVPGNLATVAVDTGYEIQIDEEARGDRRKTRRTAFPSTAPARFTK